VVAAFGCPVPWLAASGLARLHPERLDRLVHPDALDAIFSFPNEAGGKPGVLIRHDRFRQLLRLNITIDECGCKFFCSEFSFLKRNLMRSLRQRIDDCCNCIVSGFRYRQLGDEVDIYPFGAFEWNR